MSKGPGTNQAASRLTQLAKEKKMAGGKSGSGAATRLQSLAKELRDLSPKVAQQIQQMVSPVVEAIAEVDETFRPAHFPESALARGVDKAVRSPACFARDVFVDGDEAEYLLCVVRGSDSKCCLGVSVCKYRIENGEGGDAKDNEKKVQIKKTVLFDPSRLPVRLSVKIVDALDGFAEAYETHVRQTRQRLFADLDAQPKNEEKKAEAKAEPPSEKTSEAPKAAEAKQADKDGKPAQKDEPAAAKPVAEKPADPLGDDMPAPEPEQKGKQGKTSLVDLPAEAWIPASR